MVSASTCLENRGLGVTMPPMGRFIFCRLLVVGPNSLVLRPAISEAPMVSKKVTKHLAGWRFGDLGSGIYTFPRTRGGLHDSVYARKNIVMFPTTRSQEGSVFSFMGFVYKRRLWVVIPCITAPSVGQSPTHETKVRCGQYLTWPHMTIQNAWRLSRLWSCGELAARLKRGRNVTSRRSHIAVSETTLDHRAPYEALPAC